MDLDGCNSDKEGIVNYLEMSGKAYFKSALLNPVGLKFLVGLWPE